MFHPGQEPKSASMAPFIEANKEQAMARTVPMLKLACREKIPPGEEYQWMVASSFHFLSSLDLFLFSLKWNLYLVS